LDSGKKKKLEFSTAVQQNIAGYSERGINRTKNDGGTPWAVQKGEYRGLRMAVLCGTEAYPKGCEERKTKNDNIEVTAEYCRLWTRRRQREIRIGDRIPNAIQMKERWD
jgi:hypothetical protein